MSDRNLNGNARYLKRCFKRLERGDGIYIYFEPAELPVSENTLQRLVRLCKKHNIDCIIPCLPSGIAASGSVFALWGQFYSTLLPIAEKKGIRVGLNLESKLEDCFFCDDSPVPEAVRVALSSRILNCREYYCSGGQRVRLELGEYEVMAVTCYDEDMNSSEDISEHLKDGVLDYTPTGGNYIVNTYTCDPEDVVKNECRRSLNKLDLDTSEKYIGLIIGLLGDGVASHLGKTLCVLHMTDICLDMPNRRNWSVNFNDRFEKIFEAHPKNYYDALFHNVGVITPHAKNMMMSCRSQMLFEGIYSALCNVADKYRLELISGMAEPKLADSVWLNGDTMKNLSRSATARLEKAYMYGANSLRLASSAAACFDADEVYCELYGGNYNFAERTASKDAINAYAGGCTRLLIHLPRDISKTLTVEHHNLRYLERLSSFARCRALLRRGVNVSDIGILFPNYSMNSEVYLYQSRAEGFEYPNVLDNNDYMSVMNILSYFCGQDPLLIHPEVFFKNCALSGSAIRMAVGGDRRDIKIIVLPGISVISLENMRLLRDFFDAGGKIIATGRLPSYAAEFHPSDKNAGEDDFTNITQYGTAADLEVRAIARHIFGAAACNNSSIQEYYRNRNSVGGEAYYVCASKTSSDGTLYCDEKLLRDILFSFKLPLDVYMSNLPEKMGYDALNDIYPNFSRLGFELKFPGGGVIRHTHKRVMGCEVYFFANTTSQRYSGYVYLRGMLSPKIMNPQNGRCSRTSPKYVNFNREIYTAIRLELDPSCSAFILAIPNESSKTADKMPRIESIEHNFLN